MSYDYSTGPQSLNPAPPNSSMALVSLIAGILGLTIFFFFGSIVAVITGYMARKEIAASNGTVGGSGLATAGLIMGYVGIGIGVCSICAFAAFFIFTFMAASTQSSSLILPLLPLLALL